MKMRQLSCFLLSPLLCLAAGCSFFPSFGKTENKPPMHVQLNQTRFNAIMSSGKFICLIDQERPPAGQMVRDMIKIAEHSALTVEFRSIPYSLQIPALIRSGKGDVAIGNYSAKDAQEKYLDHLPVNNAICLLRQDDPDWKKILASGIAILSRPAEKK